MDLHHLGRRDLPGHPQDPLAVGLQGLDYPLGQFHELPALFESSTHNPLAPMQIALESPGATIWLKADLGPEMEKKPGGQF